MTAVGWDMGTVDAEPTTCTAPVDPEAAKVPHVAMWVDTLWDSGAFGERVATTEPSRNGWYLGVHKRVCRGWPSSGGIIGVFKEGREAPVKVIGVRECDIKAIVIGLLRCLPDLADTDTGE
jgi:hypothetical protein